MRFMRPRAQACASPTHIYPYARQHRITICRAVRFFAAILFWQFCVVIIVVARVIDGAAVDIIVFLAYQVLGTKNRRVYAMTSKSAAPKDDPFAELNSLFAPTEVPTNISTGTKTSRTPSTIEELRASKISAIEEWRKKLADGNARAGGKQSKGDLSTPTADKNFITVRLTHGPAGNLKLFLNGSWKEDHIIPAKHEDAFWKATITFIERGQLDDELNAAKKRMHDIYYNEDGTKKPRQARGKGAKAAQNFEPDVAVE